MEHFQHIVVKMFFSFANLIALNQMVEDSMGTISN